MQSVFRCIRQRPDTLCILIIIIVCVIFFSPYLFSNPTPLIFPVSDLGTDLNRDVLPNLEYVANTFKASGEIPLWRYHLLSGIPLMGHPSIPILYPLYWLIFVLPVPLVLNLIALIDFCWLGIGMYLFLRTTARAKPLPALFGAIAMALSPKWIAHLSGGHWYMLAAYAWIPWALLALDQYWKSKKFSWLLLLAIALASQGVNHIPIFIITGLSLAVISLTYLSRQAWKTWLRRMSIGWAITILLAVGLMAGQLIPSLELYPYAFHTTTHSTFTSLNPAALLVTLFPPDFKYPEWFLFPGLTVLLFVALGLAYGGTKFEKTWGWIGLAGLILSLGEYTPIYSMLFGWNPLFSILRVPTRWWLLTILSLVIMATSGFSRWMENNQRLNQRARLIVSTILIIEILAGVIKLLLAEMFPFDTEFIAILAILLGVALITGHIRPQKYLPQIILLGLIVELIVIGNTVIHPQSISSIHLSDDFVSQIQSSLEDQDRIYSAEGILPPVDLVRSGINAAEGYDALPLATYLQFIRLATGCPLVQDATGSEEEQAACLNPDVMRLDWLKLINVRLLLSQEQNEWKITDLPPGAGRVFAPRSILQTTQEKCLADLDQIDPSSTGLAEGDAPAEYLGTFQILNQEKGVNNEVFSLIVRDAPIFLIRSENWAPGWHATIDGQPATVQVADCILQGVWIEPGEHQVEFYYQPSGYPSGFWISTGVFVLILLAGFVSMINRRRTHPV